MGRLRPFPIVGGSYTDDALPWAHQDTVNYLPVRAEREGTRSPAKLAMVPGMRVFADVGTGPHRGARDVEGKRFVVSGTKLYQIALDGVATELGTIPGTGRVCMTHNQITGGNQVVIGNGSSGYVYNTYTGAFAQITDDAFPGLKSVDFLNQYILGVEPFGRYWFHSALVDAESYNALDEYQAETSPDRIMGLIALHNEVLVFGERTIEPWTNVPTENASFQLQRGSVIESGCASGNTIVKLDNSVFYLTENGQVARLNGYTPQIVSTYALEGAIRDCDWSRAFAFAWEDKGHTVYYITFPDGHTWGYDVRQNEWHRRKSYGIDRWRLNTLFKSAGQWYGGDYQTGKFYRLDWDYALEGCDPIERIRTAGVLHNNGERLTVNAVQVVMDSGSVESLPHDGVTISGAMPDAYVGDAINYQYTITPSYPGQTYTLTAEGLPDGLSIDATGLVTGTLTKAGTFAITLSAVDDCGNPSTHTDSVVVTDSAQLKWWLTFNGTTGTDNEVWFSADPLTWSGQTTRSQNVDAIYGMHWTGTSMVAMGVSQAEVAQDFDFTGGIATTLTTPTYPGSGLTHRLDAFGEVLITTGDSTFHYSLSADSGLTWTDYLFPDSRVLRAVGRLPIGRWIAFAQKNAEYGAFYYSDEALPTTWTLASNDSAATSPEYGLFTHSGGAFHVRNIGGISRTTDGAAWVYTAGVIPVNYGDAKIHGATDGAGTFVLSADSVRRVIVTHDNGATWSVVNMPGGAVADNVRPNGLKYGGGLFVVCFSQKVFVSTDRGDTWVESTLPVTGKGGYPAVEYAG